MNSLHEPKTGTFREREPSPAGRPKAQYRRWIAVTLEKRRQKNSRYSLRAFARQLGISKTALGDVIAEKRHLSARAALKIAEKLRFSPPRTRQMLREIGLDPNRLMGAHLHLVEDDLFRVIADWYHYALLSLAEIDNNVADCAWIAAKLGITTLEAEEAKARLVRLGLIEIAGVRMQRTTAGLTTRGDSTSEGLRRYHRQTLELALRSLENDPIERRDISSTTLAINPEKLPEARHAIQQFRRTMAGLLEQPDAKAVYLLAVQLFPLTREDI